MNFEISLRQERGLKSEIDTIINDFIPPYTAVHLSAEGIVKGKISALINRKKP